MLRRVDGEQAEFTARQIVAAAANRSLAQLVADFGLSCFQRDIERVNEMVDRHLKGEPLAYVLGEWDFCGVSLKVTPDVLIPRDDTEACTALAIYALRRLPENPRVLDLCTGSGCIGLAIAARVLDARVTLADLSQEALGVARSNVRRNHLTGRVSCVEADALKEPSSFLGSYDLIVSNPPYVTSRQMEELDPSVRDYEPEMALHGGVDGLDFYRAIAKNYKTVIRPKGYLCFEFGYGQEDDVCHILMDEGFRLERLERDSGERARAVLAQKP